MTGGRVVLDNDLHGVEPPRPAEQWTLREQVFAGVRFWDELAHELDNALVSTVGPERWTSCLEEIFEVQQRKYFPAGSDLLGIPGDASDTTRCAMYHCLSTGLAGSRSRYAVESDAKAWIFYLPNIMSATSAAYRRDLQLAAYRGWYVHNGPALGNDRMAFVVTHLVADGDPYDAGYFLDTGRPVAPEDRLRFEFGATPPPPARRRVTELDEGTWPEERRLKALRNLVSGWAWDHLVAAPVVLGDAGRVATTRATALVVGSCRPFFDAALGGTGVDAWADYFATVHRVMGIPVTTERAEVTRVGLGRDPARTSSFEPSAETATAVHEAIRRGWAVTCAEDGVVVEGDGSGGLVLGPAGDG